jgi:hypothetical protein
VILLPMPEGYMDYPIDKPGYTEAQLRAAYEQGLLDAMNATKPFGKVGEVIAICIAALGDKK